MPGANLTGVDLVIVEVLPVEQPCFVADQPVLGDRGRIKFDLDLDVFGDRLECRVDVLDEDLARLRQGINIGGIAVAVLGERLIDDAPVPLLEIGRACAAIPWGPAAFCFWNRAMAVANAA